MKYWWCLYLAFFWLNPPIAPNKAFTKHMQHSTCRFIRFHLFLLIQYKFVWTNYLLVLWCFSILIINSHSAIPLYIILRIWYTYPQSTVHHHHFPVYGNTRWYNTIYRFYGTSNQYLRYTIINSGIRGYTVIHGDTIPLKILSLLRYT